jgi:hypothetical protein
VGVESTGTIIKWRIHIGSFIYNYIQLIHYRSTVQNTTFIHLLRDNFYLLLRDNINGLLKSTTTWPFCKRENFVWPDTARTTKVRNIRRWNYLTCNSRSLTILSCLSYLTVLSPTRGSTALPLVDISVVLALRSQVLLGKIKCVVIIRPDLKMLVDKMTASLNKL